MTPEQALQKNLKVLSGIRGVADQLRRIPEMGAEFYANGGPGVGQGVVMDRFQGPGNARFAPLSKDYADWKQGKSKSLNAAQKAKYGKGSKLLSVTVGSKLKNVKGSFQSVAIVKKTLPILVLTGALRAAVGARRHRVSSVIGMGDTAYVTFTGLPSYAPYHHDPKTAPFPKRSPVEPNAADINRVVGFLQKRINLTVGRFNSGAVSFGDGRARIIQ